MSSWNEHTKNQSLEKVIKSHSINLVIVIINWNSPCINVLTIIHGWKTPIMIYGIISLVANVRETLPTFHSIHNKQVFMKEIINKACIIHENKKPFMASNITNKPIYVENMHFYSYILSSYNLKEAYYLINCDLLFTWGTWMSYLKNTKMCQPVELQNS